MKLTFYGGAQSVTGANYLLEAAGLKILVDCGVFQGSDEADSKNFEPFPYDASQIDAIFLTHSHADHAGRLPKLYKDGFRGKLYATPPALEMAEIALPDNLSLMASDPQTSQRPPLFSVADLKGVMDLSEGLSHGQTILLNNDVSVALHNAGHILGSSFVEIRVAAKRIYFSGDLGNPPTPFLPDFEYPTDADYIVVESAYGDRVHENRSERREKLKSIVRETVTKGGILMIPSFAMERTQELLFELNSMHNSGEIPEVPMFLDSPLAIRLTKVYQKYSSYFNREASEQIKSDPDLFKFPGLTYTLSADESKRINNVVGPKIIIAGSGMSSGGRILHHQRRYLPDPNSTILFIGFQAEGTPGRRIFDGSRKIKIFGEEVEINCAVEAIGGYSAHADQPTLLDWISKGAAAGRLKRVFAVQGETLSAAALTSETEKKFNVPALAPSPGQTVELED